MKRKYIHPEISMQQRTVLLSVVALSTHRKEGDDSENLTRRRNGSIDDTNDDIIGEILYMETKDTDSRNAGLW